jgi:hypothetical protein
MTWIAGGAGHGRPPTLIVPGVSPGRAFLSPYTSCAKKSFPLSSTRMNAGKSSTWIR